MANIPIGQRARARMPNTVDVRYVNGVVGNDDYSYSWRTLQDDHGSVHDVHVNELLDPKTGNVQNFAGDIFDTADDPERIAHREQLKQRKQEYDAKRDRTPNSDSMYIEYDEPNQKSLAKALVQQAADIKMLAKLMKSFLGMNGIVIVPKSIGDKSKDDHKLVTKTCPVCGRKFQGVKSQGTCSKSCAAKASRNKGFDKPGKPQNREQTTPSAQVAPTQTSADYQRRLYGRELTNDEQQRLLGGRRGTITHDGRGTNVVFNDDDIEGWYRIDKDDDNNLYLDYSYLHTSPERRNSTDGADVVAGQVDTARSLGVSSLRCYAAGDRECGMSGYRTWPKLGFDGTLQDRHRNKLPEQYQRAQTVQELYSMPGGKEAWEKYGSSIHLNTDMSNEKLNRFMDIIRKRRSAQSQGKSLAFTLPVWVKDLNNLGGRKSFNSRDVRRLTDMDEQLDKLELDDFDFGSADELLEEKGNIRLQAAGATIPPANQRDQAKLQRSLGKLDREVQSERQRRSTQKSIGDGHRQAATRFVDAGERINQYLQGEQYDPARHLEMTDAMTDDYYRSGDSNDYAPPEQTEKRQRSMAKLSREIRNEKKRRGMGK